MKKALRALFLSCCLIIPAMFARAGDRDANFDQGVDASSILQKARGYATKRLAPMSPIKLKLRGLKRKKAAVVPGQYPPITPLILNSAIYPIGVNLRDDPKYLALPSEVLEPFEVDWKKINGVRSDLLSQASSWEGRNDQLYRDGLQLDKNKEILDRRVADFNAEVGRYNQACTTRPLPPDEYQRCIAWRDSLRGRQAQIESDIRNHNSQVDSWNQRSQAIFDQRGTMVVNIGNWETWISNWIETVKKALAAQCRPLERIDVIPKLVRVPTGGTPVLFDARPIFKSEPQDAPACPIEISWFLQAEPEDPLKPIGFITSKSGRTTTFVPGVGAGRGVLIAKDERSPIGTSETIFVYNPAAK